MTTVLGIWCGGDPAVLLDNVHGQHVLRITIKRCIDAHLPPSILIPWDKDRDYLYHTVRDWKVTQRIYRTHHDKRIAMRDLVAFWDAEIGLLVDGTCAVVDDAELRLAAARLKHAVETKGSQPGQYQTPRVWGCCAADWLRASDTDEWQDSLSPKELAQFYLPETLYKSAREIKARR